MVVVGVGAGFLAVYGTCGSLVCVLVDDVGQMVESSSLVLAW